MSTETKKPLTENQIVARIIRGVSLLIMLLLLSYCNTFIISPGEVGTRIRLGTISQENLQSGLYFKFPFIENISVLDVKTVTLNEKTTSYTKDVQQAEITYSVNYALNRERVSSVVREIGDSNNLWQSKLVFPLIPSAIKDILGQWNAVDIVSNRNDAAKKIEALLQEKLATVGVTVSRFELTNIDFSDEFEKAVESKVVATQEAAKAENKTKQIEEEAKQKIISAQAESEAMRIKTQALSQSKSLVEYEAVQKWDGKLPTYMLGGATPFINVSPK